MKSALKITAFVAVAALAMAAVAAQAAGVDLSAFVTASQHAVGPYAGPVAGVAMLFAIGASNYSHDGHVIDYVNTTGVAIASGAVVKVGNVLGVALVDIAIGKTGAVGFGTFRNIPKAAGAHILQGESLTWDVSAGNFDDNAAVAAAGDLTGACAYADQAPADADVTMIVCFTGAPGLQH